MKTRLCVFAAVVLAAFGAHAIGEAWYTPPEWKHDKETAFVTIYDDKGNFVGEGNATVDEDGNVSGLEGITSANEVSCKALQALVLAERNKERIATIGKNLTYLFNTKKATLNKIGSNGIYPVEVGIETTIDPESESEPLKISISEKSPRVDGNTIELNTETRQYQLKNADKQKDTSGSIQKWWVDKGITGTVGSNAVFLPYLSGGTLNWSRYDGCDDSMFANWENLASQKLSLRDFHNTDAYEHTTISRLLTENNDVQHKLRTQLNLVARKASSSPGQASTETLTYIPIGDVLAGLGAPADGVSIEGHVEGNTTNLAIKGWHNGTATPNVVLADLLTEKKSDSKERPAKEYTVLVREHDNAIGSNTVAYASLGNLYGVTWATNWTEAVEHITKEETVKIVNWVTNSETIVTHVTNTVNWVTNEVTWVTNSMTIVTNELVVITNTMNWVTNEMVVITNNINLITNEMVVVTNTLNLVTNEMVYVTNTVNIISNQLNWVTNEVSVLTNEYVVITNVTEKFSTIENWMVITNYFVNYLGGGNSGGGGGGSGGGTPPEIPPEHDPYSPEYQHDPLDEVTLPVKNALLIKAMTNELFAVVNATNVLDCESLYTNDLHRAEINGYWKAATNQIPVKVRIENDDENRIGDHEYGIEWMDYPTALMAITSKDIDKIQKWLKVTQTENIFTLVASNTEKVAMLQTSPYNVINANALLDNASIWTNDNFLAEVKGFQYAPYYSYPVKVMGSNNDEVEWTPIDQPDSLVAFDYGDGERLVYNRSLARAIDYGVSSISNVWSLYGFNESVAGTVPRIGYDELGNKELEWIAEAKPDSEVPLDYMPYNTTFSSIERTDDYGVSSASNVWAVYGFRYAAEGTAPHVHTDEYGNKKLKWGLTGNAVRVVGTDGSEAVVGVAAKTNTLTFASAADSNVKATVFGDGAGNVTVTFGVYYLQESNLNGGSGGGSGL